MVDTSALWDRHLNPDCATGKHTACGQDAWCYLDDCAVSCACTCHTKVNFA